MILKLSADSISLLLIPLYDLQIAHKLISLEDVSQR